MSPVKSRTGHARGDSVASNASAGGIISAIAAPITNLFAASPSTQQAVRLDDGLDKPGESSRSALTGKDRVEEGGIRRVEIRIGGMTCGACVASIESGLKQPGIKSVQISLLAERGVIEYEEDWVGPAGETWSEAKIAEEVEDIGFDAEIVEKSEVEDVELRVYG